MAFFLGFSLRLERVVHRERIVQSEVWRALQNNPFSSASLERPILYPQFQDLGRLRVFRPNPRSDNVIVVLAEPYVQAFQGVRRARDVTTLFFLLKQERAKLHIGPAKGPARIIIEVKLINHNVPIPIRALPVDKPDFLELKRRMGKSQLDIAENIPALMMGPIGPYYHSQRLSETLRSLENDSITLGDIGPDFTGV